MQGNEEEEERKLQGSEREEEKKEEERGEICVDLCCNLLRRHQVHRVKTPQSVFM